MSATSSEQKQPIPFWVWGTAFGLVSTIVTLLLVASIRPSSKIKLTKSGPTEIEENHLAMAKQSLDGQRDLGSCRQALNHLNKYRMTKSNELQKIPLQNDIPEAILAKHRDYLQSVTSPGMDAWYIEECLFFREIAIAGEFSVKGRDSAATIKAASELWDWIMREVALHDSPLESAIKAPLHWILRRGTGTAEERALIFLAMLRQVGIPDVYGCLIRFSSNEYPFQILVGVRTLDGTILLFDPVLGLSLQKIKNLGLENILKGNWKIEDWTGKAPSRNETNRCWNDATFGISIPLPALATRNQDLLYLCPEDPKAIPIIDTKKEIQDWYTTLKLAGISQPKVSLDMASLTRWTEFLPGIEGGNGNPGLLQLFSFSYVPWDLLPKEILEAHPLLAHLPAETGLGIPVPQPVGEKLMFGVFAPIFRSWHETAGKGRDLLVRFQFAKVVPELKQEKEEIQGRVLKRFNDAEKAYIRTWISDANTVYANLARKGANIMTDEHANSLWERSGPIFMIVLIPAANARMEEIQVALALAKHEQASQLDRKLANKVPGISYNDSVKAWRSAAEGWAQLASDGKKPNAIAHIARYYGEAIWKSGNPSEAKKIWNQCAGAKDPDARACAILAKNN